MNSTNDSNSNTANSDTINNDSAKSATPVPKSSGATLISLGVFLLITIVFFVIRSYITTPTIYHISTFIYFGLVVISQYITNLNALHIMCNNWQYGMVFFITIIPWVMVFGVIALMLSYFPGWLIPFSNTFGYGFAKLSGLQELMTKIVRNDSAPSASMSEEQRKTLQTLYYIKNDPSLIINEMTCFGAGDRCTGNFNDILRKLSGIIFKEKIDPETYTELSNMIKFKETVSEAIWYILFGTYTIMITNVGIVNTGCNTSAVMMKERYAKYKKNVKAEKESAAPNKLYTHKS